MPDSHAANTISDASSSLWRRAVIGRGEDQSAALHELASSYWYCVYAWWRRAGLDPAYTATATIATFDRWLGDSPPVADDTGVARMRDWILARLPELGQQGVKRMGEPSITIDHSWAELRYAEEPEGQPDSIFLRRWALSVIESATTTLRDEYYKRGEEKLHAELLAFAGYGQSGEDRYSSVAQRLGQTAGAIRKSVFEFRSRQREVLHLLVADTVLDPADVDSEITALVCACDATGTDTSAQLPLALQGLRPDEILVRAMRSVKMTQDGSGMWQPPTITEAALLFPNYEIVALIGRGGMGAVYRGRQVELDRPVAIKLLPLEVSIDPDFADRFRREARAMAKLNHPNIILIHEFGSTFEGHLFFVMEFVEGADLHQMIHGPGVTPEQSLSIISGVCDALAYAHGKGVVHRDIKPANVMVSVYGEVKVADFGLARLLDPGAEQYGHTMTGTVMGTPDYMAPEQMRGMNVDHRADIYSLGVMLYEMLCGEVPRGIFDPPSARVSGLSPNIDQVVIKAMQQQPDRRYQSTTEMKTDVGVAAAGPKVHKAPKPVVAPKPLAPPPKPAPQPAPKAAPKAVSKPAPKSARAAKFSTKKTLAIAAACLVPLLVFVMWFVNRNGNESDASTGTVASTDDPAKVTIPASPPNTPSWIQPELPPPNAEGWITIFDGKVLYGATISEADMARNAVRLENESLVVNNCSIVVSLPHTDVALRFSGLTKGGRNLSLNVRSNEENKQAYGCWFNAGKNSASALSIFNPTYAVIKHSNKFHDHTNFFDAELRVVGSTQTLLLGGQVIASATDTQITSGKEIKIATNGGRADFKRIEVKLLSPAPGNTAGTSTGTTPPLSPKSNAAALPKPLQEIDLLALVDPVRDRTLHGGVGANIWEKTDGILAYKFDGKPGKFSPPISFRAKAFEIEVAFRRETGGGQFHIDLPISDKNIVMLVIGKEGGDEFLLGNKTIGSSPGLDKLLDGRVIVRVLPTTGGDSSVTVLLNGAEVAAWTGNMASLQKGVMPPHPDVPGQPITSLYCQRQNYEFSTWKLRVSEGEAKVMRQAVPAAENTVASPSIQAATKEAPFVNSLGMKFVPVPITGGPTDGKRVLFSIWETRVQDYEVFANETKLVKLSIMFLSKESAHPANGVDWESATRFCEWLTKRDRITGKLGADEAYRLPTDHEWSCAVGIGEREDAAMLPAEKNNQLADVYPWGSQWPPPKGAGNFAGEELRQEYKARFSFIKSLLTGSNDGFLTTSPVGSFPADRLGLHDLSGNVFEWCQDWSDGSRNKRVIRGGSWLNSEPSALLSSHHNHIEPSHRGGNVGFRCVLASTAPAPAIPADASTSPGPSVTPLPRPDGKPADMTKPVKVFILMGQLSMVGFGQVPGDKDGTLEHAVKKEKLYPFLIDESGKWTERKDVREVFTTVNIDGGTHVPKNEWMRVKGGTIGPELGIGHQLGNVIEEPVLILKSCKENRNLGWDLLPPGSERYLTKITDNAGVKTSKVVAGYKDKPDMWDADPAKDLATEPPKEWLDKDGKPIEWYAGKQYDDDTANAKTILANLGTYYPGATRYEVVGFFWWQGERDLTSADHSSRYEKNLVQLIKALRKDFNSPNAKFVLATLCEATKGSTGNGGKILDAMLAVDGVSGKYPEFKGNVATVYTNPLSEGTKTFTRDNRNAKVYMEVGLAMGEAMLKLQEGK